MLKYSKHIIALLFLLAILLGLAQRKQDPYVFKNSTVNSGTDELRGYYQRGQDLATPASQNSTVTFLAVSDIMLSRNVAGAIEKANNPLLPFGQMADILKSTDFNFANLETPLSSGSGTVGGHSLIFNSPINNTKGLLDYNFKILNLANNHAFDQGLKGLTYTKKYLADNKIETVGAGENLDQAWQLAVVEANGIKICFVGASYASVNDNGKTTNNYVARMEDVKHLKTAIMQARLQCDFVVATMHGGTEYTHKPNKTQTDFAHTAIDDGADMVIGAHPHWVQTIEKYNGRWIFYSLGNFIFDQEWSHDTKEGLALKIQISKSKFQNAAAPGAATLNDLQGSKIPATLDSIELIPIIIENYSTPRPATADETKKILGKIGQTESLLK